MHVSTCNLIVVEGRRCIVPPQKKRTSETWFVQSPHSCYRGPFFLSTPMTEAEFRAWLRREVPPYKGCERLPAGTICYTVYLWS